MRTADRAMKAVEPRPSHSTVGGAAQGRVRREARRLRVITFSVPLIVLSGMVLYKRCTALGRAGWCATNGTRDGARGLTVRWGTHGPWPGPRYAAWLADFGTEEEKARWQEHKARQLIHRTAAPKGEPGPPDER